MKKGGKSSGPYTAHLKGKRRESPKFRKPDSKAERQLFRYYDLREDFYRIAHNVAGRTAILALPGPGCTHSTEQFRPVHWENRFKSRPFFVAVSASMEKGEPKLELIGATSAADLTSGKLKYSNGDERHGQRQSCSYDFLAEPQPGAQGAVLDSEARHVLFTAANNCLQELIASADKSTEELSLPRLVCLIEGDRIPIDQAKLEALVALVPEELRAQYRTRRVEAASILSLGTRFADAALLPDAEIKRALADNRAYEDFTDLLGASLPNPIRKVLYPFNPAKGVLGRAGLGKDWHVHADEAAYERLMDDMRACLPLPELAAPGDILDALADPDHQIRFSRKLADIMATEPASVVRAMRATFPMGAAVREYVKDDELFAAAQNPELPLRVGAYARIQVVESAALGTSRLPSYATGSFWPMAGDLVKNQAPVWSEDLESRELEPGDVSDHVIPCAQTLRESISQE